MKAGPVKARASKADDLIRRDVNTQQKGALALFLFYSVLPLNIKKIRA
jgi:hypothetical protein